ncbi:hypothetical protein L9F63_010183 [Diploptera punctata]|uniref:Uncharacterized protein n=1 Tax=Diploptera punctata TaxID=6984 RepID=A0AAD8ERR2_DIPPU|nr:hypothetical protein L9F63_010183 [Diploptera punctata]
MTSKVTGFKSHRFICVWSCQKNGLRYCGQLSCGITLNSPGLPDRIRNSFQRRVRCCIQTHGQHFEYLL